jgi:hypothetical protein
MALCLMSASGHFRPLLRIRSTSDLPSIADPRSCWSTQLFVLTGGASRRETAASAGKPQPPALPALEGDAAYRHVGEVRPFDQVDELHVLAGIPEDAEAKAAQAQYAEGLAAPTAAASGLDSLAQSCGLSLPTFNTRGWIISSSIYAASSSASIASTDPISRQHKRVDFLTRYCGLSLPTLFKRIGTMAADGQPLPSAFASRRVRTRPMGAERTDLARHTANPFAGTVLPARPPAKTTPTTMPSGPARTPSQARLDNRKRMAVVKPSSRPIATPASQETTHGRSCWPFA